MDHLRYDELMTVMSRAPVRGRKHDLLMKLRGVAQKVEVLSHPVSLLLLKSDIDKWESLFVLWLEGKASESDRIELKVIQKRIDEAYEAINSYEVLTKTVRSCANDK